MKDEARLENIEQLKNLIEADSNEHALKEIEIGRASCRERV